MDERSSAEAGVGAEVQIAPALAGVVPNSLLLVEHLRAMAEATLHYEGAPGQVTLVITDDRGIRDLNRDFLDIDAPTDVLAFSAREEGGAFVVSPEGADYVGDVVISYPRAVAQAEEIGHPVEQELTLLVVHGLLHLLGYDHAKEEDRAIMWARQETILRELCC